MVLQNFWAKKKNSNFLCPKGKIGNPFRDRKLSRLPFPSFLRGKLVLIYPRSPSRLFFEMGFSVQDGRSCFAVRVYHFQKAVQFFWSFLDFQGIKGGILSKPQNDLLLRFKTPLNWWISRFDLQIINEAYQALAHLKVLYHSHTLIHVDRSTGFHLPKSPGRIGQQGRMCVCVSWMGNKF